MKDKQEAVRKTLKDVKLRRSLNAKIEELSLQIKANEAKRVKLDRQKKPIEKEMVRLYHVNQKLQNEIDKIKTASEKLDWAFILECHINDSTVHHDYRNKILSSLGISSCGYCMATQQAAIQIAMTKGDPENYKRILLGLQTVLPHLKSDKEDEIHIHILERNLSAGGSWSIAINREESTFDILHSDRSRAVFGTLEQALKYVQENVWYQAECSHDEASEDA